MTDIIKKPDVSTGIQLNKGKLRSASASPFQQRVNAAKAEAVEPDTMPNRLCLMLDDSASMAHVEPSNRSRIELLKDAVQAFVSRCNLLDTSLAYYTFNKQVELNLTIVPAVLDSAIYGLRASNGTPMHRTVVESLDKCPMTRGIIVSDGAASDWGYGYYSHDEEGNNDRANVDAILFKYKEAGIPIDCVHISTDVGGEELLRRIAAITGGLFIKFTDVGAFATAFAYLTPGYRALLANGSVKASDIGARDIEL